MSFGWTIIIGSVRSNENQSRKVEEEEIEATPLALASPLIATLLPDEFPHVGAAQSSINQQQPAPVRRSQAWNRYGDKMIRTGEGRETAPAIALSSFALRQIVGGYLPNTQDTPVSNENVRVFRDT